jgi:hypothetical protein
MTRLVCYFCVAKDHKLGNLRHQLDWGHDSSGRVHTQQLQGPEFIPSATKTNQNNKPKHPLTGSQFCRSEVWLHVAVFSGRGTAGRKKPTCQPGRFLSGRKSASNPILLWAEFSLSQIAGLGPHFPVGCQLRSRSALSERSFSLFPPTWLLPAVYNMNACILSCSQSMSF